MNKNEKNLSLVLFFSLIGTYLVTFTKSFPYTGFALFIVGLVLIVKNFKDETDAFSKFLLNSIIVLAIFIPLRSNENLIALNILAIFYLGALVSLQNTKDFNFRILEVVIAPLVIFFDSLTHRNEIYDVKELKQGKFAVNTTKAQELIKGLAISFLVLIIILPLLSEANPFFSALIDINIPEFIEKLFGPNAIFKAIVFTFLMIFIPRFLSRINVAKSVTMNVPGEQVLSRKISTLLPKVITILTLTVFLITQLQLYMSTDQSLQTMGYTSAVKTREVFSQLTIVSIVILLLIFKDKNKEKLHQVTSYLLALQTAFLVFVALKSDIDNIMNWGFTHTRLYGLVFLAWIAGMLSMTLYNYHKNLEDAKLIRNAVVLSTLLLGIVNTANFDQLIWQYGRFGTENGTDNWYLAQLSPDAGSYKKHLEMLMSDLKKMPGQNIDENNVFEFTGPAWMIVNQIHLLRAEYSDHIPVRGFNLARYIEYKKTKDIDLEIIEAILTSENNSYVEFGR